MMHFPKETAFFFSWNDIKTSVMTEHITEQKHPLNLSLVQILSSDWNREKSCNFARWNIAFFYKK